MSRFGLRTVAIGLSVALLTLTACGSSSSNKTSAKTITVGVLTDLTGPGSNTSRYTLQGIKAGVALAASEGYHIKYDIVDAATNPTQALNSAKELVDQDHVFAVIGLSTVMFAASTFLHSKGVPVIGADYDASEWLTTDNMFSVFPYENFAAVSTTIGEITKLLGGTNLATLGYGISPSSADVAKAYAISAQDAGIKDGYVNAELPFGTTNVGPEVLAMKSAGIDAMFPVTDTNTGLDVIIGLRQAGVDLKVPYLAEEEGDLLGGGPATVKEATGVDLVQLYEPAEMDTAATREFASYLKAAAQVTTQPTMLLGSPISFAAAGRGDSAPCTFVSQWTGTRFVLLPGTHPYCGKLTGQKV